MKVRESDSRLVFFYTTEGKERIAKRKIDGERWLDDCVVLFLVRKQYLTIPFGDLNSYNGRQEEKEDGKSGQNVLLDELTNPRLGWMLLNHIVPSRIFFHSPLWIFLQNILRGITYWLECVHISDQSVDLFIFGAEFLFNKFRRKIRCAQNWIKIEVSFCFSLSILDLFCSWIYGKFKSYKYVWNEWRNIYKMKQICI